MYQRWLGPALLTLSVGASTTWGQARNERFIEPHPFQLKITDASLGLEVEGTSETSTSKGGGAPTSYEHMFVAPTLGLGLEGFVYHPNLVQFRFNGEGGSGWGYQQTTSGPTRTQQDLEWYGQFGGNADLFAGKPLNGSLSSNYGRTYHESDFFNHSTVEQLNYGSRLAFQTPGLSLATHYVHTDETLLDATVPSSQHQDVLNFDARNTRLTGESNFDYTFNQFASSGFGQSGVASEHGVSLGDSERFGRWVKQDTRASYTHHDSPEGGSDEMSAGVGLGLDHGHNLTSGYGLDYGHATSAGLKSDSYSGNAIVTHQLYSSLTSSLFLNSLDSEVSDSLNSGYTRRYGFGWAEAYTKRLGSNHRLQIYHSIGADYVEQKGAGRVENERHAFPLPPSADSFLLNLPDVTAASIIITDGNGLQRFRLGIDYEVLPNGILTEIRRILGGNIPEGSTVLVDYQATPTGTGNYLSVTDSAGIRLEFWKNLWGIYARMNLSRNNAPRDVRALDKTNFTVGTDVTWRWLRAGAEYDTFDSSESSTWSARFYQSGTFRADALSSVSINLSESYSGAKDNSRQEQDYRIITRYRRSLSGNLNAVIEGGVDKDQGTGVDQMLAVARLNLDYHFGRTTVQLTYDFAYNLYQQREEVEKHMLLLRVRRRF